jgi:hypothetical protein
MHDMVDVEAGMLSSAAFTAAWLAEKIPTP